MKRPANRWLLIGLFLIAVTTVLAASILRPIYSWDLVMYIAAAKSYEEADIGNIHSFTYHTLERTVPETVYLRVADRPNKVYSTYARRIYDDVAAFQEQMPFYNIRPIYIGLIYTLHKAGFNMVFAAHVISAIAVVLALGLLYVMSSRMLGWPLAYAVPFFALIYGATDIARISTPDGLAFLAIVLSACLYLKQRIASLLVVLPMMLGVRTDLILYTMPMLLLLLITRERHRVCVVVSILASVAAYFLIGHLSGNGGWATIFYHTMIELVAYPLSNPPTLSLHDYLSVLLRGLRNTFDDGIFILYALVVAYGAGMIIARARRTSLLRTLRDPAAGLFLVCLVCVFSRVTLFPVTWIRYFAGPYMIGTFALLAMRGK